MRRVPGLRLSRWLDGRPTDKSPEKDVSWFGPDGMEFGMLDWDRAARRALCVHIACHPEAPSEPAAKELDRCLFLFNADVEAVPFTVPAAVVGPWRLAFDTADSSLVGPAPGVERPIVERRAGDVVLLPPYSSQLYHAGAQPWDG